MAATRFTDTFTKRLLYSVICIITVKDAVALFEKCTTVDLSENYEQYVDNSTKVRSEIECSVFCYSSDDCRAFLLNHETGECTSFNQDISDSAEQSILNTTTFSYYKDKGINHVSGRGDYSWQDSKITSSEGFSYLALDGIYTSSWSGMSCMHTGDRYNPWWAVDFGSFVKVKRINIYQRTDSCCVDRFANVKFMVGDTVAELDNYTGTMCALYVGPASMTPFPIQIFCDKVVRGRYLKVYMQSNIRTSLCFCEIEVYSF